MAQRNDFSDDEMKVDEGLGYPRAYAKLCRDRSLCPYSHGPPFTFTPYPLHPQMASKEREMDEMFPVIDFEAKPTTKPRIFLGLLWKQLNHLGNAGFDPAVFRVDPYGNVIYYHADSASPLAWEIDHWFPLSRGGLTVPSNLRILQWQVCKRKHHKLEILVPWWDLQLGISINQFLSIFAASNSDFRHRGFSLLFKEGACEELNETQSVDSHNFPHPFADSKERLGLAPAAVVVTRKDSYAAGKTLDTNRQPRPYTPPIVGAIRSNGVVLKEKENPDMVTNPYQAIVMARDSLRHKDETSKMKMEIQRLDDEMNVLKRSNEEEKLSIQDLEMELIKHKRRAEKCRRVAEAQSSYRAMLEKMIRDAMHQSVVYKEQVRLNQAASSALMARLEAQKAICNSAEKQLHSKFKQKEDLEKQIRPEWEQARKRSRIDDDTLLEDCKALLLQPVSPEHKELRLFLEDEQKLAQARLLLNNDGREKGEIEEREVEHQFDEMNEPRKFNIRTPVPQEPEVEEDEESRKERGKGNVEKWLHMLLGETQGVEELNAEETDIKATNEEMRKLNERYPQKQMRMIQFPEHKQEKKKEEMAEGGRTRSAINPRISVSSAHRDGGEGREKRKSFSGKETAEKGKGLTRSESAGAFRPIIPSSPSMILGMRKGVDCIRKKPLVIDDEDDTDQENVPTNRLFRPSIRLSKKTAKV